MINAIKSGLYFYERSELLLLALIDDGDGKKSTQKNVRRRCLFSLEVLPASDSELRPRRRSGVRLAYTDPSGERQRAPSTPRWSV